MITDDQTNKTTQWCSTRCCNLVKHIHYYYISILSCFRACSVEPYDVLALFKILLARMVIKHIKRASCFLSVSYIGVSSTHDFDHKQWLNSRVCRLYTNTAHCDKISPDLVSSVIIYSTEWATVFNSILQGQLMKMFVFEFSWENLYYIRNTYIIFLKWRSVL